MVNIEIVLHAVRATSPHHKQCHPWSLSSYPSLPSRPKLGIATFRYICIEFFPPQGLKNIYSLQLTSGKTRRIFSYARQTRLRNKYLAILAGEIQGPGTTLLVMKHVFVLLVHLLKSCLHKLRFRCFWVINHKDAATRCCEVERGIAKQASNKSEFSATTMDVSSYDSEYF